MLQILNLILNLGLIATIFLYIFVLVQDIKKLSHKGTVIFTERRDLKGSTPLLLVMTLYFCWMYIPQNEDRVQKVIVIIFGITIIGYWAYRTLSRQKLCENAIITPDYIYLAKDVIGYEWSSLMEEEGMTKLWIKITRKSWFGKDTVKEVCFNVQNQQIPEIQEVLNTWNK